MRRRPDQNHNIPEILNFGDIITVFNSQYDPHVMLAGDSTLIPPPDSSCLHIVPLFSIIVHATKMCVHFLFRINRATFEALLDYLRSFKAFNRGIAPWQVLMFMWYIANRDKNRVVARLFGVSKSTVHKYIHKVSRCFREIEHIHEMNLYHRKHGHALC